MPNDFIAFEWRVPRDGFMWSLARPIINQRVQKKRERFLTPGFTLHWQPTFPLRDMPALFRVFGETPPTDAGILGFANAHGALGLDDDVLLVDDKGSRGERLETWVQAITHMHHAVLVWDAVRQQATADLRRWFALDRQSPALANVRYSPDEPWPFGVLQSGVQFIEDESAGIARFLSSAAGAPTINEPTPQEAPALAQAWLRSVINVRLEHNTSARMLPVNSPAGLSLHIVPRNLLGALWLQFAVAIEGQRVYRHCETCQNLFEVSTAQTGKRADAKFCSDLCRMRFHRKGRTVRVARKRTKRPPGKIR